MSEPRFIGRREVRTVHGEDHYECRACGQWLPAREYYPARAPGSRCPVLGCCKGCHVNRVQAARERRPEYWRAYHREYDKTYVRPSRRGSAA